MKKVTKSLSPKKIYREQIRVLLKRQFDTKVSLLLNKMGYLYASIIAKEESSHLRRLGELRDMYIPHKIHDKIYDKIELLKNKIVHILYKARIQVYEVGDYLSINMDLPNHKISSEMLLSVEDIKDRLNLVDYKKQPTCNNQLQKNLKRLVKESKSNEQAK